MARNKCPEGMWCFTNEILFGLIGILVIAIIGIQMFRGQQPIIVNVRNPASGVPIINNLGGDERYSRAPQPLRDWMEEPEYPPRGGIATIPINIPTQGLPESFQSIGNINVGEGKILPLYGRRTMRGSSDRWNYYTRTDTYNPVPVPIRYKNRDCMDDIGCAEVYSGENLFVEDLGVSGKVRLFKFDGPKYVPGLL
jgi:Family of unknown function (DUF5755)